MDSKPRALELINEIGLGDQLIKADAGQMNQRFLCIENKLYPFPKDKETFLKTPLLSTFDRLRLFFELTVPKGKNPDESAYDFVSRRFGKKYAELILDPMLTGIFAGDAKQINLKAAFPRVYQLEQTHGSLLKALKEIKKSFPKHSLCSFKEGMGSIINRLVEQYKDHILVNQEILSVKREGKQFKIILKENVLLADYLIFSTPAPAAVKFFKDINLSLSNELSQIDYVPVAVLGLIYPKEIFKQIPQGFGYLLPSSEKSEVLGVLFENNIFPGRCPSEQFYFRVMMGGSHHRGVIKKEDMLIDLANVHISKVFGLEKTFPKISFKRVYAKAIPQYDNHLVKINALIDEFVQENPTVDFVSNYRGGVSFNDCIENAFQSASKVHL